MEPAAQDRVSIEDDFPDLTESASASQTVEPLGGRGSV